MSSRKSSRVGSIIGFSFAAIITALAVGLVTNRQVISDQLAVWSFTPSGAVQTISDRIDLTEQGQRAFFATKPEVADSASFNENCPRQEVGNPILGCYTSDDRIYIYDLTNEKLYGMEEVTAAHELLHAVWTRHGEAERKRLTDLLLREYDRVEDETFKERMAYYQRNEPGEFANELHSIFGTEVSELSAELESYYAQYFTRDSVLSLHQRYVAVYNGLYQRADELYVSMETLGKSIQSASAQYSTDIDQYAADVDSFNARADSGDFSSNAQFYSERQALLNRSAQLEARRLKINSDIDLYNQYYQEYQGIAAQIDVLDKSLDSFSAIDESPTVQDR